MQVIRLTGVLDDGSDLRPSMPFNTARTIQLPLLSDVTIEVAVFNNAGVAVDLASSSPAFNSWFSVVKSPNSCDQSAGLTDYQLASTTVKTGTRNVIQFVIGDTVFRQFEAGRYFYDVALSFNGSKYQVIRISGLHLEAVLRRA